MQKIFSCDMIVLEDAKGDAWSYCGGNKQHLVVVEVYKSKVFYYKLKSYVMWVPK